MHIIGIAKDSYTNDVQGGDHSQRFFVYAATVWYRNLTSAPPSLFGSQIESVISGHVFPGQFGS